MQDQPTPAIEPDAAGSLTARAEALYRQGDYAALVALLQPLAGAGVDPGLQSLLGLGLVRLGQVKPGLARLRDAWFQAPAQPWSALHLGIGLHAAGLLAEAVAMYRRAHEAMKFDPVPLLNWTAALLQQGDAPGAVRVARRARMRAPRLPDTHRMLAEAYLASRRWTDAVAAAVTAVRLAPRYADGWVTLGVAQQRHGQIGAAKAAMRAALAIDPAHASAKNHLDAYLRVAPEADA